MVDILGRIRGASLRMRGESIYVDFRPIRNLSPATALMMAAALDRYTKVPSNQGRSLRSRDIKSWDPVVRHQLADMGLFKLLNVSYPDWMAEQDAEHATIRYVQFRTGNEVIGKVIDELRKVELDPNVDAPQKLRLFDAVTEAMTNVKHHAYVGRTDLTGPPNWWLSAMYDTRGGGVSILIYDQGQGIPKALPQHSLWEKFRRGVPDGSVLDDAIMIQVAHDLSRSKTGERHRGHGLQRDIRRYADEIGPGAMYRVVSGARFIYLFSNT